MSPTRITTNAGKELTKCPGCGVILSEVEGPTHPYMISSAACYDVFTRILAAEYSQPELLPTHRLSVDTYAVQHPGIGTSRREIQSVGLHLARLSVQTSSLLTPKETNDVMLGLGRYKSTLQYLLPPDQFTMTVADVEPFIGGQQHAEKIKEWAMQTWEDWADHHAYINAWVSQHLI